MIIRNSKFKQVIPDNFTYKGTKYTKAYAKGKQLFGYSDDDYKLQYFTIESLEDGNVITLTIGSGVTSTQMTSISYSVDNGSTWNTTTVDSTTQTINVNLDKGEKVLWKGVGKQLASGFVTNGSSYYSVFASTKNYAIYGNLASLIDDTNFASITESTGNLSFCGLFYNSSKLIDCDNLVIPFTKYKYGDLSDTFRGTSIVNSPHITVNTVNGNFALMRCFTGCSNLENIENLKLLATNLGYASVYNSMFSSCTSLATAPELPATTLGQYCYSNMFYGCTSLVKAPELLATTLVNNCYSNMFDGCTSLNYIKCLATDISATGCTTNWVRNVASTGTFIKADNMSSWVIDSVNGIPIGWTLHNYENCTVTLTVNDQSYGRVDGAGTYHTGELVTIKANANDNCQFVGWYQNNNLVTTNQYYTFNIYTDVSFEARFASTVHDYSQDYFTIESLENSNSITLTKNNASAPTMNAYYSLDNGATWTLHYTSSEKTWVLNTGEKLLLKCSISRWCSEDGVSYNYFKTTKKFDVYGNIMSLLKGDNLSSTEFATYGSEFAFNGLFFSCKRLVNAKNLVLPATTLKTGCYRKMFFSCTSLITGPELPATTLAPTCYGEMFYDTDIETTPQLPATNLPNGCYYKMFNQCHNLKTITSFTVNSVGTYSCYYMFASCRKIKNAPITLAATTLAESCYEGMFLFCSMLTSAPELPARTLAENCYYVMLNFTKINNIKIYASSSSWPLTMASAGMLSTGTYYVTRYAGSTILNACPTGWTISKTL